MNQNSEENDDFQSEGEESYISYYIGTILILICGFLWVRRGDSPKKKTSAEKGVIIAGESNSGKTALLYFLAKREMPKTVSSMAANDAKIKYNKEDLEAKVIRFVDIPGHVNFREDVYDEVDNAKGIIYLVDSSQKADVDASGSFLYDLFLTKSFTSKKIPIIIVSNKRDLTRTINKNELREELIKEVERIKVSKKSHTSENTENDYLFANNQRFEFGQVKGGNISFADSSVVNHEIDDILNFIKSLK